MLITLVRIYRWVLSPAKAVLFGPLGRCRFTPSCSEYALEAIQSQGALKGLCLSVRRLARCHPWGGCGHDPVPAAGHSSSFSSSFSDCVFRERERGREHPAPCGNKGC